MTTNQETSKQTTDKARQSPEEATNQNAIETNAKLSDDPATNNIKKNLANKAAKEINALKSMQTSTEESDTTEAGLEETSKANFNRQLGNIEGRISTLSITDNPEIKALTSEIRKKIAKDAINGKGEARDYFEPIPAFEDIGNEFGINILTEFDTSFSKKEIADYDPEVDQPPKAKKLKKELDKRIKKQTLLAKQINSGKLGDKEYKDAFTEFNTLGEEIKNLNPQYNNLYNQIIRPKIKLQQLLGEKKLNCTPEELIKNASKKLREVLSSMAPEYKDLLLLVSDITIDVRPEKFAAGANPNNLRIQISAEYLLNHTPEESQAKLYHELAHVKQNLTMYRENMLVNTDPPKMKLEDTLMYQLSEIEGDPPKIAEFPLSISGKKINLKIWWDDIPISTQDKLLGKDKTRLSADEVNSMLDLHNKNVVNGNDSEFNPQGSAVQMYGVSEKSTEDTTFLGGALKIKKGFNGESITTFVDAYYDPTRQDKFVAHIGKNPQFDAKVKLLQKHGYLPATLVSS